jgi:23S rRNA maturation-related 3'-5' exoribonuclease YhaM
MDIEATLPRIETIEDDDLRSGVATAWRIAAEDNGLSIEEIESIPWYPPAQRDLDIPPEAVSHLEHVEDVLACAVGLVESISDRSYVAAIDMDTVIAGALVHDVSKLYEFDGMDRTEIGRLLGHPYFGVSVVARAGLPTELSHIILSHSPRTAVEPATIEAALLGLADEAAATGIRAGAVDDLRNV